MMRLDSRSRASWPDDTQTVRLLAPDNGELQGNDRYSTQVTGFVSFMLVVGS